MTPRPVTHNFLLRYWARTKNREALDMVLSASGHEVVVAGSGEEGIEQAQLAHGTGNKATAALGGGHALASQLSFRGVVPFPPLLTLDRQ